VLGLLFWQWRPISATVWHTTTHPWTDLVWTIYAGGWLIAIAATFMLDHADFLGLKQANQRDYQEQPFRERWLYVRVRHPMMLGLMIAFWATPAMTAGHALFAAAATGYIAIGVRFEERDLRRQLGGEYDAYARRVPALFPRIGRRIEPVTAPVEAHLHGQQGG
jgi:methanethiol S-methyltransferase